MSQQPRFHLAFPVNDLAEARAFYGELLGCREGRSSHDWVDFDFFGHQIVAHLTASGPENKAHNVVDGEEVPVRHFGVILTVPKWKELAEKLRAHGVNFIIEPQNSICKIRPVNRQRSFANDPSGNALEFKAFADETMIFAK